MNNSKKRVLVEQLKEEVSQLELELSTIKSELISVINNLQATCEHPYIIYRTGFYDIYPLTYGHGCDIPEIRICIFCGQKEEQYINAKGKLIKPFTILTDEISINKHAYNFDVEYNPKEVFNTSFNKLTTNMSETIKKSN